MSDMSYMLVLSLIVGASLGLEKADRNIPCADRWVSYDDGCYQFNTTHLTWIRAKKSCEDQGARLLVIESQAEDKFVSSELQQMHFDNDPVTAFYWIAGTDLDTEGQWMWDYHGEQPINYTNWYPGQPDNFNYDGHLHEDCMNLVQRFNYQWNDSPCGYEYHYICEQRETTEPIIG